MVNELKIVLKKIPLLGSLLVYFSRIVRKFDHSESYWESRYAAGGNSGCGSYGRLADFKAKFLNEFITKKNIKTVVEFGCGDGNQLRLCNYPNYIGLDVSLSAINICKKIFRNDSSKQFFLIAEDETLDTQFKSELSMSLDVIYHLVEDCVYEKYMKRLFSAGSHYVIIYSSNIEQPPTFHVKHRKFDDWVLKNFPDFELIHVEKNKYPYKGDNEVSSLADFYVFENKVNLNAAEAE
jgi:hypothetical protein